MYNVFNFSLHECLLYLAEDKHILNYLEKRKTGIVQYSLVEASLLSEAQYYCLDKQLAHLRTAIVVDCIEFIGLSKTIDFNKMGPYKPLLLALFTKYTPTDISHYKLKCQDVIYESIKNNSLGNMLKDEIIDLIEYTQFRMQHIDIIINMHISIFRDADIEKYKEFTDNIPYEFPYPFLRENKL